jgi:hypothetical protein
MDDDIERVSPEDARHLMAEGALLICAYEDEEQCRRVRLDGALTMGEFRSRQDSLSKETPLIFYCA